MIHHRSRVLLAIALVGVLAIAGCVDTATLGSDGTTTETERATINATAVETWVHEFVNEEREARGLDPLARNDTLDDIARYHSEDMADRGYFAHESPSGETMKDRFVKFGIDCWDTYGQTRYLRGSENIAQTYHHARINASGPGTRYHDTPKEVARGLVDQWMNSTGHRENILTPYWTAEGIGVHVDGRAVYATQNFCK